MVINSSMFSFASVKSIWVTSQIKTSYGLIEERKKLIDYNIRWRGSWFTINNVKHSENGICFLLMHIHYVFPFGQTYFKGPFIAL